MPRFRFGIYDASVLIEAPDLPRAIRRFRVGTMFPHTYSDKRIGTEQIGRDGYTHTVYLSSQPGACIPVAEDVPGTWREVARIPVEDPEAERMPSLALPEVEVAEDGSTALALPGALTGIRAATRSKLEQDHLALEARMGDLERQRRELVAQMEAMKAELQRRIEQVWVIELFLGVKEEVTLLRDGERAPIETPITVRQRVLCMDEEIAVHDWLRDPDKVGQFDYKRIEDFDRWLVNTPGALDAICPWQKGIVGLRVRRMSVEHPTKAADIAESLWRVQEDRWNQYTYLLVRNGERLCRLWVDVALWPRLFASAADATPATGTWARSENREKHERVKHQLAGLIAIQGLLERSDLLDPKPAALNVLNPACEGAFRLIRDDEETLLLADQSDRLHATVWEDLFKYIGPPHDSTRVLLQKGYHTWLKEQLAPGVRVMYVGRTHWSPSKGHGADYHMSLANRVGGKEWVYRGPVFGDIYTLDEFKGSEGWFKYLPDQEVTPKRGDPDWEENWQGKPRSRRVTFRCWSDEVIPVDFLSWRVIEHLIRDRGQREHYNKFFRLAFRYWQHAKAEAAREKPFIDLVLFRAGVTDPFYPLPPKELERERARCERILRWWKVKTKEHRTLGTDEAKALRMVEIAFRRGEDYDNDPEYLLLNPSKRGPQ